MSFVKECCTRPPVQSNYSPKGAITKLGDLDIYETVDKTSKRMLILIYDIFGMTPNPKQFADIVGASGYRVVIPDVFRGKPYPEEGFPPKDFTELMAWVKTAGSWDNIVKPDLVNLIAHYKKQVVTSFGIFGFCFGGKMSVLAATHLSDDIKGAGLIHGSMIEIDEANYVKAPILLVPSKDEPDMLPFAKIVKERLGEDSCVHVRLEDMFHGYAGARGDFTNELNRKRVDETIELLVKFFDKHTPN